MAKPKASDDYNPLTNEQEGLYRRAVEVVKGDRKANTSYIQRKLKVGFNTAAGLVERMVREGIVSEANHIGQRKVLVASDAVPDAATDPVGVLEHVAMQPDEAEDHEPRAAFPLLRIDCRDFKTRLRQMKPFQSTEKTRVNLNGIYCRYFDKQITLCATNGHILQEQIFDVEAELSENLDPFKITIPSTAIDHLLKVLPTGKDAGFFTMQVLDDGKNVRFDFFEFEYLSATIELPFPDYKTVIPAGTVKMQSGLNAAYLILALEALGNNAVDLSVDSKEDAATVPHLLTSDKRQGMKCVIMPMRVE